MYSTQNIMKIYLVLCVCLLASIKLGREKGCYVQAQTKIEDTALNSDAFIREGSTQDGLAPELDEECRDRHVRCDEFVEYGNCDTNPGFMIMTCPVACNACHLRDLNVRCDRANLNMSQEAIFGAGEMYEMLRNIVPRYVSSLLTLRSFLFLPLSLSLCLSLYV